MIDEKKFINFITALEEAGAEYVCFDTLRKFVDETQKIGEWIPCKDKLPELNEGTEAFKQSECVLVNIKWYDGDLSQDVSWLNENGNWSCQSSYQKDICEVIAWQPLPDDYIE